MCLCLPETRICCRYKHHRHHLHYYHHFHHHAVSSQTASVSVVCLCMQKACIFCRYKYHQSRSPSPLLSSFPPSSASASFSSAVFFLTFTTALELFSFPNINHLIAEWLSLVIKFVKPGQFSLAKQGNTKQRD